MFGRGDSGALGSTTGFDGKQPSTIYAFDVDPKTQQFMNRRVFAWIDTGIPDGIQVDSKGNVYASTGDGVHVSFRIMKEGVAIIVIP